MKIAINIDGQFHHMSGIQHYLDSLLGALYASGTAHDITAFAPALWSATTLQECTRDGLFAWRDSPRARVSTAGSAFRLAESPLCKRSARLSHFARRLDWRLTDYLKQSTLDWRVRAASRKYDLLHTPSPATLHFELCQAKYNIVTIYDLTTRIHARTHTSHNIAIWERLFAYAKNRCSRVLTISEASKRDIVEHLGLPEDRIDVTPLAARAATRRVDNKQTLREALSALGLADTPFVLYAGTLEPRKNLERLTKAFSLVLEQMRWPPHKLVLAGGSVKSYGQDVLRLAEELGVKDRVIMTGYVSNETMNVLMSACDLFVYVSEYEGFGLPPLEAMVCGAPVVVSNVSSLPEVVGDAGVQVSPKQVEQIASAIHLLLTDPAENARQRALSSRRAKCFTWERAAALTLRSYEAAVS